MGIHGGFFYIRIDVRQGRVGLPKVSRANVKNYPLKFNKNEIVFFRK